MKCPFCDREIKEDARFCPLCGKKIPEQRPAMNQRREAAPPPRFCKNCGRPCVPGQLLCADCLSAASTQGHAADGGRKKRSILPLVLLILLLLVALLLGIAFAARLLGHNPPDAEREADVGIVEAEDGSDEAKETDANDADGNETGANKTDENQADANDADAEEGVQMVESQSQDSDAGEAEAGQEHRYEVVKADISWTGANEAARAAGGHLATITTQEELDAVSVLAKESGLKYLWLGAYLSSEGMQWNDEGSWITGESWQFDKWYPSEPSVVDTDGTRENYLCLWNVQLEGKDIGWTFNDQRNDIVTAFPDCAGKVGYLVEYGDGKTS